MKRVFLLAGIIIVAIIVGIFVINYYETDTVSMEKITKVGVIFNGSRSDQNWNQSHYEGLEKTAEVMKLAIVYQENIREETITETIDELVAEGCEIIIANSFEFGEAIERAAFTYPDVYFFHATGIGEGKNLTSYFGRMYQIRYLCGIIAGLQTQTNEIGYVAAFPISEVNRGINAFTLGVRSVNPKAKVFVSWTASWTDDNAAAEATYRLLNAHEIDLIAMHTDSLRPLEIAEEKDIMSIGYNVDNSKYFPNTYLTAAVWDWASFYEPNILRCIQGKFEGYHYWEGIETGMVSLAPLTDKVKEGVAKIVEEKEALLKSGTFDVFYGPVVDQDGVLRIAEGESMTDNAMLNEFDWYVEGVVIDEK